MKPDLFISCDIEADGPVPGPYSMSSLGMCAAGLYDGSTYTPIDHGLHTFYRELAPISDLFVPEAAAVSGIPRQTLIDQGADPAAAMADCAAWVRDTAAAYGARPVFAAYPAVFDFAWTHYYFVMFNEGDDPFGFSACIDMKTLFAARSGNQISRSTKRFMPKALLASSVKHDHHALHDAQGQADLLRNLMTWTPPAV